MPPCRRESDHGLSSRPLTTEIQYFGWSGIAFRHADAVVGFDLFGDAVQWADLRAGSTLLCATHGHPEHCGSLRHLLRTAPRSDASRVHLISSPPVVAYVIRRVPLPGGNVHAVEAGRSVTVQGIRITAFSWRHMPLLPPGFRPKIDYLASLARRPVHFLRIGLDGLRRPLWAPKLGYHVRFPDGSTAVNYSEGLHRLTDAGEVKTVARALPAKTLVFAVEPEDLETIPRWVDILRPSNLFLYEPHRPWRELFRLPYADLSAFAERLSERFPATRVEALMHAGQTVRLERPAG